MTRKTFGIALCALGLAAHGAVDWDDALVVGHTNGDKCFYDGFAWRGIDTLCIAGPDRLHH